MERNGVVLVSYTGAGGVDYTWGQTTTGDGSIGFDRAYCSVSHAYTSNSQPTAVLIDLNDMTILGFKDATNFYGPEVLEIMDANI